MTLRVSNNLQNLKGKVFKGSWLRFNQLVEMIEIEEERGEKFGA